MNPRVGKVKLMQNDPTGGKVKLIFRYKLQRPQVEKMDSKWLVVKVSILGVKGEIIFRLVNENPILKTTPRL